MWLLLPLFWCSLGPTCRPYIKPLIYQRTFHGLAFNGGALSIIDQSSAALACWCLQPRLQLQVELSGGCCLKEHASKMMCARAAATAMRFVSVTHLGHGRTDCRWKERVHAHLHMTKKSLVVSHVVQWQTQKNNPDTPDEMFSKSSSFIYIYIYSSVQESLESILKTRSWICNVKRQAFFVKLFSEVANANTALHW